MSLGLSSYGPCGNSEGEGSDGGEGVDFHRRWKAPIASTLDALPRSNSRFYIALMPQTIFALIDYFHAYTQSNIVGREDDGVQISRRACVQSSISRIANSHELSSPSHIYHSLGPRLAAGSSFLLLCICILCVFFFSTVHTSMELGMGLAKGPPYVTTAARCRLHCRCFFSLSPRFFLYHY